MACGKPPDPSSMTPARPVEHPALPGARGILRQMESVVRGTKAGSTLTQAMARAQWAMAQAEKDGVQAEQLQKLKAEFERLKGQAHRHLQRALNWVPNIGLLGPNYQVFATKTNIETVKNAIRDPSHYAHKDYTKGLMNIVGGSTRIPDNMKAQLAMDFVRVLEICPHGGGLVTELTMRGQRQPTGSASKLGNRGNAGLGTAYELMGTAALSYKVSSPRNAGAPSLFIDPGVHNVNFGNKISLDRVHWDDSGKRTGIECDISIYDPGDGREIGVDFKHTSGVKGCSAYDRRQIEGVVQAIHENQLDEYHFVTNRTFSDPFMAEIGKANEILISRGDTPIGCHEYVTTMQ